MTAREGDQILVDLLHLGHTLTQGRHGTGFEIDSLHEAETNLRRLKSGLPIVTEK
jgi:hypothetical protein